MGSKMQNLDLKAVQSYLESVLPGFSGPVTAEKFPLGQSNPTFKLETPHCNYALRRKPPGKLLKSAHAVDREFRVQSALFGSDVPVAQMHHFCDDDSIIGSAFYVMEHIDGVTYLDPSLPDLVPAWRTAISDEMNRVLAAIHSVDINQVGLADFGPEGSYFERQVERWSRQYRASETETIPQMNSLIAALEHRMPQDDGRRALVHGDYRLDNLMFEVDGTRCLAVLDWELSTLGHPFADLASVVMQWQMPAGLEGRGLAGLDRFALGLPTDEAFVAQYCQRMGLPGINDFGFCLAFCFFRMAAIIQGVKKRAIDGNASNPEHGLRLGKHVPAFASGGLKALQDG